MNQTPSVSSRTISIIVPCRNEVEFISKFLENVLHRLTLPEGFGCEVIVVDGMSTDGTRGIISDIAHKEPRLRLLDNPHLFTPHALNIGIRAARGSIIMRMDVHSEYSEDYISRCIETLLATGADNVGGPWVGVGTGKLSGAIAQTRNSPFAIGGARGHRANYEGPVDTVFFGCWRREIFETVGLFDEELVRNQDDEHNLRINRAGGKLWQSPHIRSRYIVRSSLKKTVPSILPIGLLEGPGHSET